MEGGFHRVSKSAIATVRLMRDDEGIRVVIHFDVIDVDRFREMAAAMVEVSRSEPGTRVYDWYVNAEAHTACLYEAYESFEAIVAHTEGPVFTDIAPKYIGLFSVSGVEVFGDAGRWATNGDVLGAPTTWWGPSIAALTA